MKTLLLQNKNIYPEGTWQTIANEREYSKENDENIYYYVDDNIDLKKINKGDIIILDEIFNVLEIE